jgi:hypothetical protein
VPRVLFQPAHALAFLAQVDEVKEQAEGVRNFRGAAERQAVDFMLLRSEQVRVNVLADLFRELAKTLDGGESFLSTLLADNRSQARRQQPNFPSQGFVHELWSLSRAALKGGM